MARHAVILRFSISPERDFAGWSFQASAILRSIRIGAVVAWIVCLTPAAGQERTKPPLPFTQSIERPNRTWDFDGKRILGHVGEKICVWDAATGKLISKMRGHKERLFTLKLSPDGVHLLSSSWMAQGPMLPFTSKDTRTIVWNLKSGAEVADFPEQIAGEFSPDGKRIVTFSKRPGSTTSFDAAVWDVFNKREIATAKLDDHSGPNGDALHFSPDGKRIAHIEHGAFLLYNYGSAVSFDAGSGRANGKKLTARGVGGGHRFTSNGALASWGQSKSTVTEIESGRVVHSAVHDLGMVDAIWSHDGSRVAALRGDKELKILELATGKMTTGDKLGPYRFGRAVVSPDNRRLIVQWSQSSHNDPAFGLFDFVTGKEIARIEMATWGHVLGFAPDSGTLLVGGSEFVIHDAETGKKLRSLKLLDDVSFEHDWNR